MFKNLKQKISPRETSKISKLIARGVQQALIETVRALHLARRKRPCHGALKDARFA